MDNLIASLARVCFCEEKVVPPRIRFQDSLERTTARLANLQFAFWPCCPRMARHWWLFEKGRENPPISQSCFPLPRVDKRGQSMNNAAYFQNVHPINVTAAADGFVCEPSGEEPKARPKMTWCL